MNYVVINLEDNSSHFFDTEQIAFDYIFSKIGYMTARMLTDNPADKEVEDLLDFLGSDSGENAKIKYDSDQLITAFSMQKRLKKNEEKKWEDIYNDMKEKNATTASYIREVEEASENEFIPF